MAVTMMVSKDKAFDAEGNLLPDVEVVTNYPGHEEGITHGSACPHYNKAPHGTDKEYTPECVVVRPHPEKGSYCKVNPHTNKWILDENGEPVVVEYNWNQSCHKYEPLYMRTTHRGVVLRLGENNGYHDSDFYAVVWDREANAPKNVYYASTRGWTYPNNAAIDATDDVVDAYRAWCDKQAALRAQEEAARYEEYCRTEALAPRRGAPCKVVKGRKVPVGTEGVCIWHGAGNYGPRVGIKDAEGNVHYTAASNVERLVAKPDGQSWVDFLREEKAEDEARQIRKGHIVRVIAGDDTDAEGEVIYVKGDRIGVATSKRKVKGRYTDVVWTWSDKVERLPLEP